MMLLTKEIIDRMPGPRGQEGKGMDAIVHLKLFDPFGQGTWLITEAWKVVEDATGETREIPLKEDPAPGEKVVQTVLYGYCFLGDWEWGPVLLEEIESVRRIEREKGESDGKHTVRQLAK